MKLNSEHFFELATPEINAIWRVQCFSDTGASKLKARFY